MSRSRQQTDRPGLIVDGEGGHDFAVGHVESDRSQGLFTFLVSGLIAARYFLPAESAALGGTLWIVQFWFIAGVLWFWLAARSRHQRRSLDGLDWGLGLLVGGHVLSAVIVLATDGDRRAALNMLWEWLGIGLSTLMIREVVSSGSGRIRLLSVVVLSAVTLSGLGLWQHYVWYPQVSALLTEYKELSQQAPEGPAESASRENRLNELRSELGLLTFTDNPAAAELLRARIAASVEPIGRFALTNTFAGLLLAGLLLGIGGVLWQMERTTADWRPWAALLLVAGLTYCFWLTKSRTAWVGLFVGLTTWGTLAWQSQRLGAGLLRVGGLFVLLLVVFPLVASLFGGLDREVITEVPKSMQYRLEYWSATGGVIRDHPWIGVGPGNFRQAYLQHKLPGSSEEVLDPHNLFLDVWANGGLLALVGLFVILIALWRATLRIKFNRTNEPNEIETGSFPRVILWRMLVGGLALGMAAFTELFNGAGFSDQSWPLLIGWCCVSLLWPTSGGLAHVAALAMAATIALVVHLMGAGGIAMPAILQTLIMLAACAVSKAAAARQPDNSHSVAADRIPWRAIGGAVLCFCLAVACAFTATLPVSETRTQTQVGRMLMTQSASIGPAMNVFRAAATADSLTDEPWHEIALAQMTDWSRRGGTDDETFTAAVAAQQEAIQRNPHSAHGWQMLGRMWWRRYELNQDRSAVDAAFAAFQHAVELYPNQAILQLEYAQTAAAVEQPAEAIQAAEYALKLDDLNRQHGHIDKYISKAARNWAETLIQQGL